MIVMTPTRWRLVWDEGQAYVDVPVTRLHCGAQVLDVPVPLPAGLWTIQVLAARMQTVEGR